MIHLGGKTMPEHAWCHIGFYSNFFGLVFDNALQPAI